ncbi:MAG: hypothetical protein Q7J25_12765 [Vicinamibacterales bacterium]|nr:hypothetical protein [Vicinamibacterales bacterium]
MATSCGGPPAMATFFNCCRPTKKAMYRLSGDQNGRRTPSVPSSSRTSNESSDRIQIEVRFRVTAVPTKAIVRPSGDMRGHDRTTPGGDVTANRVGCGAGSE